MVGSHRTCAVRLCNSSGKKAKVLMIDISFHIFPKNIVIKNEWIKRCKRPGKYWNPDTSFVCSLHFKPEDYERNLQAELLGYKARKKLKFGALPSLNLPYYKNDKPQTKLNVDQQSTETIWIKAEQKDLSESEEEEMSNRSSDLPPMSIKTEIDPELDPLKIKCSSENSTSNNKERLNGSEEEEETSNRFPLPLPITPVTIKIEKDSELDPFDPSGYSQNEASNTKQEQDSRTRKRKLSSNSNSISNDNLAVVSPKIKSTDDADDDYDTFGKLIAFQLRELAHYNGRICQEKILSLIKEEQRLLHLSSSQEKIGTKIKQEPFEFIKTEICSDTSEEF